VSHAFSVLQALGSQSFWSFYLSYGSFVSRFVSPVIASLGTFLVRRSTSPFVVYSPAFVVSGLFILWVSFSSPPLAIVPFFCLSTILLCWQWQPCLFVLYRPLLPVSLFIVCRLSLLSSFIPSTPSRLPSFSLHYFVFLLHLLSLRVPSALFSSVGNLLHSLLSSLGRTFVYSFQLSYVVFLSQPSLPHSASTSVYSSSSLSSAWTTSPLLSI